MVQENTFYRGRPWPLGGQAALLKVTPYFVREPFPVETKPVRLLKQCALNRGRVIHVDTGVQTGFSNPERNVCE